MSQISKQVEDELADFLGRERKAQEAGYSRENVIRAVGGVGDALQAHILACDKRWTDNQAQHASIHRRVLHLESSEEKTHLATIPESDPADITGVHDMKGLVTEIAAAVRGGQADPDINAIVEAKQAEADERRELRRLQKLEEEKLQTKRENRKAIVSTIVGVVGGAGAIVLLTLGHWLGTLHH